MTILVKPFLFIALALFPYIVSAQMDYARSISAGVFGLKFQGVEGRYIGQELGLGVTGKLSSRWELNDNFSARMVRLDDEYSLFFMENSIGGQFNIIPDRFGVQGNLHFGWMFDANIDGVYTTGISVGLAFMPVDQICISTIIQPNFVIGDSELTNYNIRAALTYRFFASKWRKRF